MNTITNRLLTVVLAGILTGCASGRSGRTVSFDLGAFALMYADTAGVIRAACENKKLNEAECVKLRVIDEYVREAIVTPGKEIDWAQVMQVMGGLARLAAKAAI